MTLLTLKLFLPPNKVAVDEMMKKIALAGGMVIVNDIIAFLLDAGGGLTGRPIDENNNDVYYNSPTVNV